MKFHTCRFDELPFSRAAILLQIDHRLDAERRQVSVISAIRLRPTIVVGVDLTEVVDADARRARDCDATDGFSAPAIPTADDKAIVVASAYANTALLIKRTGTFQE